MKYSLLRENIRKLLFDEFNQIFIQSPSMNDYECWEYWEAQCPILRDTNSLKIISFFTFQGQPVQIRDW